MLSNAPLNITIGAMLTMDLTVLGLGYIGLPLAASFAKAGFKVTGADIRREVVTSVNSGTFDSMELGLKDLVETSVKRGNLYATTDVTGACEKSRTIIICVQTPVDNNKIPDLSAVRSAAEAIAKGLRRGKLVIVESTVFPRTTEEVVKPILEKSGLKAGRDFYLAYCSERATPGSLLRNLKYNDRVVGGVNKKSMEITAKLYSKICKGKILKTDVTTAEFVKLIENTYRDINIALSNEIAIIAEKLGINTHEAIRLANFHPNVKLHKPGCGVGGTCIPKDPWFLVYSAKKAGRTPKLLMTARKINDYMPAHTIELIKQGMKRAKKELQNSVITVLGVAYKNDVDITENSPAERIIRNLLSAAKEVRVYDPYSSESFGGNKCKTLESAFKGSDCAVFVTDHSVFQKMPRNYLTNLVKLMKPNPVIVDGRGVVRYKLPGVIYVSI